MISDEAKKLLRQTFEEKLNTTHDPAAPRLKPRLPPEEHRCYARAAQRPLQQPIMSERTKQLAGLVPY